MNTELQMSQEQFVFLHQKNIKNIFTKVLKGHIAVVNSNLNKFKTGKVWCEGKIFFKEN